MDIKERAIEVWDDFIKRIKGMGVRPERQGKHRRGNRPGKDARALLLAARKRDRQARRYARMRASGNKNRFRS